MQVRVHHWQFETGEPEPVAEYLHKIYPSGYRKGAPRGWHCWAYPSDDRQFEQWMKTNCPTSTYTHRFNSGDPMYTVYITNNEEATSFKLQWM